METLSNVPFIFIHSFSDRVEIKYYNYISKSYGLNDALNESRYKGLIENIFIYYNRNPNFIVYVVNNDQHGYTPTPYMYYSHVNGILDEDSINSNSNNEDNIEKYELMSDWLFNLPMLPGDKISSQCAEGVCDAKYYPKNYKQRLQKYIVSKKDISIEKQSLYIYVIVIICILICLLSTYYIIGKFNSKSLIIEYNSVNQKIQLYNKKYFTIIMVNLQIMLTILFTWSCVYICSTAP
jgi:hypothetical protein